MKKVWAQLDDLLIHESWFFISDHDQEEKLKDISFACKLLYTAGQNETSKADTQSEVSPFDKLTI